MVRKLAARGLRKIIAAVYARAPAQAQVKQHPLLDLRGNIPSFIFTSDGKLHDRCAFTGFGSGDEETAGIACAGGSHCFSNGSSNICASILAPRRHLAHDILCWHLAR